MMPCESRARTLKYMLKFTISLGTAPKAGDKADQEFAISVGAVPKADDKAYQEGASVQYLAHTPEAMPKINISLETVSKCDANNGKEGVLGQS
jgi:hypothetical protein